ncbi:serine/threonine protein kinase [Streptomyces sp. NPDC086787]|uniref:serine/threonine protein kinase n=1 Tax=Streptomyces sp. NPDC086787 TaxID=3365759 RepID=UPI00382AFF90
MTMVKANVSAHEWAAGRYRLVEAVHREENRVCWSAEDLRTQEPRLVTQTVLPRESTEDDVRRAMSRILRTTELMGALRPGRVATVLDVIEDSGTLWTVMEWIDGVPLGEFLARQGTPDPARAARIGLDVLDVLEAAHGEGFTHGELSPGQLFVPDRGPVVLTGFGLAGATLAPRVAAPSYASPEQARDERIGPAADLWALGAILYTMVEGRPPFRDRGRPEATLRAVDRLPLRTPLRAGPLAQVVTGLLRKNSLERLTRSVAREALTRVLTEDTGADHWPDGAPRSRSGRGTARWAGRRGQAVVTGVALAVVAVSATVFAVAHGLPGGGDSDDSAGAAPRPTAASPGGAPPDEAVPSPPAAAATPGTTAPTRKAPPSPTRKASPSPSPSVSSTATALPAGFRLLTAPEGFSVALPTGWKRLETTRADPAYRVIFGPGGDDPRTLAVTYSEDAGPDPVAVWRDDVQPALERTDGFQRIGAIEATTYQGYKAADMEWLTGSGTARVRTFGRGFLIGGGRSFSLRFTAPAAAWDSAADRQSLSTFLRTFRIPAL